MAWTTSPATRATDSPSQATTRWTSWVCTTTMSTPMTANTPPVPDSPNEARWLAYSAKTASNALNALMEHTVAMPRATSTRRWEVFVAAGAVRSDGDWCRAEGGWVSGNRTMATTAFTAAMPPAIRKGRRSPPNADTEASAGPATNPTPKAAPRSPNRRGRSAGSARSVTAAWATPSEPPDPPSTIRATKSSQMLPARPVARLATAVPTRDMIRTGLRPIRSDRCPHTGASANWAAENEATSRPMVAGDAPNRLA